ncbi:methionine aminotransferase [Maribacter sp. 2308TA10-17]|uniref:methionine aminotransferase n=1 Tax=Maribacter sp. 2308TA10-17 TaxID=3386276 RepID=UPI0039BD0B4F
MAAIKKISSKLPNLPTSIFTIMSKMAKEYNAINISQGFPDFDTDPKLIELVTEAMKAGHNQYAPMSGIYSFRAAICEKVESLYGAKYHPKSEVTVTSGATEAIYSTISAFVSAGDEVIVFKPAYDCYEPAILGNGGIPVFVQLNNNDFKIDWNEFQSKISAKTRMVIINTPHNPSGTIFSENDMLMLQEALENTNIILLSDEAYEHIVFDGLKHESVARYPKLVPRSVICASFGKTFHITGWKIGYCVAPKELMQEIQKIHEFNVFSVSHPVQKALNEYLKTPNKYLELNSFFQKKRDLFLEGIKDSRFSYKPSQGTYFQLLDYSQITDEGDVALAKRLTIENGVASIPISVFNENQLDNKLLRFCFAKKDETLEKATEILSKI